jgi:hypothetical protein
MALYIPIRRIAESPKEATYHFGRDLYAPDPDRPRRRCCFVTEIGRVQIDKTTGQITFLQTVSEQRDLYESRVARRLQQALQTGEFPPSIDYAT